MKHLKFVLLVAVLSLFHSFRSECLAGSVQASATVRLLSDLRNPIEGTVGLEQSGVRLSGSLGNDNRQSYGLDFLVRSKDGLYVGVGITGDRIETGGYESSTSDTTVTSTPHDHGRHIGDKHKRSGKIITQTDGSTILSLGSLELDLRPALILGVSARHGLLVESRVIFGGEYDAETRTSVGVRF